LPVATPPKPKPEIDAGVHLEHQTQQVEGMFTVLRHAVVLALLTTAFASNIGTWMHDVGASWLMTSLGPSPVLVSLIQTAVNLAYFLMGLIAGALADIADRRRLIFAQF
jgi:MFS family permease